MPQPVAEALESLGRDTVGEECDIGLLSSRQDGLFQNRADFVNFAYTVLPPESPDGV